MNSADEVANRIIELADETTGTDTAHHVMIQKLDEVLFYINMVKNSATVSLTDHQVLTKLYTGQLIYLDDRDVSVSPHLIFNGIWEEHSSKVLRQQLCPGDTFFDVGANFGYFSLLAGLEIEPTVGRIHLFEANPDLIPYLEKSLSVNGLIQHSVISNVAIADEEGTLKLNRIKHQWGGATMHDLDTLSRYRPVKDEFDAHFDVPAITIDSYVDGHQIEQVDFVKIDVEGLEDRVYGGMTETISANPNLKILLEFTSGAYDDAEAFFQQIVSDFTHVYMAPEELNGELLEIRDIADIANNTRLEIAMLLLTNSEVD